MSQAGALGSLMLAFEGTALPGDVAARLASAPSAGITLFRFANVASPGQVRELTDAIRRASAAPPLIGADQEGGQFLGLGDGTTPFAGNMALGAVGDAGLAERVGRAIGLECRALGVNLAYAPVCDLASNPANPAIGIRSFGDDPSAVATLVAATVRGLQSAGVAAGPEALSGHRRRRRRLAPQPAGPRRGARRAGRPGARPVPGRDRRRRPRRDVRPPRAAAADRPGRPALDALAAGDDGAAPRRAGLRGRLDHRRARHAGARPGPQPRDRRPGGARRGRRPAADRPGRRGAGTHRVRARPRRRARPDRSRRRGDVRAGASRRSTHGWRASTIRTSTSWAARPTASSQTSSPSGR